MPSGLSSETVESLRAQVRELNEKLVFANETIAIMEEKKETKGNNVLPNPPSALTSDDEEES